MRRNALPVVGETRELVIPGLHWKMARAGEQVCRAPAANVSMNMRRLMIAVLLGLALLSGCESGHRASAEVSVETSPDRPPGPAMRMETKAMADLAAAHAGEHEKVDVRAIRGRAIRGRVVIEVRVAAADPENAVDTCNRIVQEYVAGGGREARRTIVRKVELERESRLP